MAWTSMPTFTPGPLTSAQLNVLVANINESAAAKATTAGRIFVSTGANAIAERAISSATTAASDTTTSTSYADLTPAGPAVTVTTGANAIAFVTARMSGSANGAFIGVGVGVSGASTIAASDADATLLLPPTAASAALRASTVVHFPGTLTAGSNTFTMKYRVSSGTGTFQDRKLTIIAL